MVLRGLNACVCMHEPVARGSGAANTLNAHGGACRSGAANARDAPGDTHESGAVHMRRHMCTG